VSVGEGEVTRASLANEASSTVMETIGSLVMSTTLTKMERSMQLATKMTHSTPN